MKKAIILAAGVGARIRDYHNNPKALLEFGINKITPFLACCAAVWIHGDIAKKFGPGLIAEDIVKNIPNILKKLKNRI